MKVTSSRSRRAFIQRSAIAAGSLLALGKISDAGAAGMSVTASADRCASPLIAAEVGALKAVIDRLIPTDALGSGAVASNVHEYIICQLGAYFKRWLPLYQKSLALIDAAAQRAGAESFAALSASRRDALLTLAEAGQLGPDWRLFFPVVLEHTREGMFGDPMYGGNLGFAGWDLIQYPGVKLVWSAQQQAVGATLMPSHISAAIYGGHPIK